MSTTSLSQLDLQCLDAYAKTCREDQNQKARLAMLKIFVERKEEMGEDPEMAENNSLALLDLIGDQYKGDFVQAAKDFLACKDLLPSPS